MSKGLLPLIRIVTPKDSRLHMVNRDKFVIGRSPEADVMMMSNSVSRKHLLVEIKGEDIFIEDLGSSNGTFLNDVKLEAGKKYPITERTTVRLGTSNENISFELMDRPTEFKEFSTFLKEFNEEFMAMTEKVIKEANAKAEKILQEAQARAAEVFNKAKSQENTAVEAAQAKANTLLKNASTEAQKLIDNSKQIAESDAKKIRDSALAKARAEAEEIHRQALEKAREAAHSELEAKKEQAAATVREHLAQLKTQSQMEAEQVLQNAHKEANKVKESAIQEIEKLRFETQKRSEAMLEEAEIEANKILQHAREATEKMRQTARQDFDETLLKAQMQSKELIANGEKEAAHLIEVARKKAQTIVELQEKESKELTQNLRSEIEKEAKIEAERLLLAHKERMESEKLQLQKETQAVNLHKAEVEGQIKHLDKERKELQAKRDEGMAEVKDLLTELNRLKDENSKQKDLNEKLSQLEASIKALEFQRAQLNEKNEATEQELSLLKKRTFEELERVRREEERKVMQVAANKAKEFSAQIEKVVVTGINEKLTEKLNATQLNEISHRVSEELINLFAAETFKNDEKVSMQKVEAAATPSFLKTKTFRIGAAAAVIAGIFLLVKNSEHAVKMQDQFTEALIEKQRDEATYKPEMTVQFRSSYTDNILYMERYVEMKMDEKVQDQWALNLNDFFLTELKLSEENMVRFIGLESAMIKKLSNLRNSIDSRFLEEGIQRMRDVEREDIAKIQELLVSPMNYEKLRLREKVFLAQLPLSIRDPAQAPPLPAMDSALAPEVPLNPSPTDEPVVDPPAEKRKPAKAPKPQKKALPTKLPPKKVIHMTF